VGVTAEDYYRVSLQEETAIHTLLQMAELLEDPEALAETLEASDEG
jgi:hypothetical protein